MDQANEERSSAHVDDDPLTFLTAVAQSSLGAMSTTAVFVFGSEGASMKEVRETPKPGLGAKGKGPRWSGKWTGVWKPAKEGELVGKVVNGTPVEG